MKTAKLGFISIYFFLTTLLSAQWSWSSIPCPGGIPNCLYMDRKTEDVYAGCYGGVWKLNQSTNQWALVDSGVQDSTILPNAKMTALYLDKSGVFYAGCDSNTPSYISYNSGKTWQQIQDINFTLQQINCITEHPNGSVFLGTNGGKIIRTMDHGKTWTKLNNSPAYVNDIIVDSSETLWVATANGVFNSLDNGETWTNKSSGLMGAVYACLAINSKGILFTSTSLDIYKSENGGGNWTSIKNNHNIWPNVNDMCVDESDGLFTGGLSWPNNIYYSINNGSIWTVVTCNLIYNRQVKQIFCSRDKNLFLRIADLNSVMGIYTPSSVNEHSILPSLALLEQNYPNPFNPSTTIKFSIPSVRAEHVQPLHVLLKVFDLLGREIATLLNEEKPPGNYEATFTVETRRGESLSSGVYFYTLHAGDYTETKKMLLMK